MAAARGFGATLLAGLFGLAGLVGGQAVASAGRWARGRVVAVTAQEAYVAFGAHHGLRRGDTVTITVRGTKGVYRVLDVHNTGARIELTASQPDPSAGMRVRAKRRPSRAKRLPKPDRDGHAERLWRGVKRIRKRRVAAPEARSPVAQQELIRGLLQLDYSGLFDSVRAFSYRLQDDRQLRHTVGTVVDVGIGRRRWTTWDGLGFDCGLWPRCGEINPTRQHS